ncbi:MAG: endolytic transglycosylase MltG [Candidatus Pacebacteria bacterium]|nr:endolytic transglycosylase MltG [Candidatus Paceibacterota bacterium]
MEKDFKKRIKINIKKHLIISGCVFLILLVLACYAFYVECFRTPSGFVSNTVVSIERGQSLISVARELRQEHIITSTNALIILGVMYKAEHTVVAGDYLFEKPVSVFTVAKMITHGDFRMTPIKVTIPEGTTVADIGDILKSKIPQFDQVAFLAEARGLEGYLFPDTYFLSPAITATDTLNFLQDNFQEKLKPLETSISQSGRSSEDIIKMASILEEEVQTPEDRAIVAGILWKRIDQNMPLQVDSTIGYVVNKKSSQLTVADLANPSPYNTYTHRGLPPTPISNPGIESIMAALQPKESPYLYFLSDSKGITHYATTFAEHVKNKKKYLY